MYLDKFEFYDTWLLHSIILCSRGAKLKNIIATGDMLNHAIFSYHELNYGMNKLINNDYVVKKDDKYFAIEKAMKYYTSNKIKDEGCITELFRMTKIFESYEMKPITDIYKYISVDEPQKEQNK